MWLEFVVNSDDLTLDLSNLSIIGLICPFSLGSSDIQNILIDVL